MIAFKKNQCFQLYWAFCYFMNSDPVEITGRQKTESKKISCYLLAIIKLIERMSLFK